MNTVAGFPILLPLYVHPSEHPTAWRAAQDSGAALTVVAANRHGGHDPELVDAMANLAAAGVATLGYVDAGHSTRPVADLLSDVAAWVDYPAAGVFLDQVPTSPFSIGPVAMAARAARRAGLDTVILNPGAPPDPLYRDLGAAVCTFDGPWSEYRGWNVEGSRRGDGHLVHSVPADRLPQAWAMLRARGAGFGLASDLAAPRPYNGGPSWLVVRAAAGTGQPTG
jgi:hypothetical protein